MPAGVTRIGTLTRGERVLIDRRRRGETQAQAAARYRVRRHVLSLWERDEKTPPLIAIGRIECHERCLLYRRRSGFTQERIARDLKLSRWWVNKMERGLAPCDTLIWYWEQ